MKEFKKRLEELKELLKDKKKRAIILLGMYVAFIVLVLVAIQGGTTPSYKQSNLIEDFNGKNNYNYSFLIHSKQGEDESYETIYGKRFEDKRQLIYKDQIYNFESGKLIGFPIAEFDIGRLEFNNIYSLIAMSNKTSKDEMREVYELSLPRFIKFMNDINIDSDEIILIEVMYPRGELSQINIDLTNYVNFNQDKFDNYMVSINYNNIGNVIDF
jgi:hypothetical protein